MTHNCHGDQAEGVEQSSQSTLCANGCGFFANPACNNMCSKCYRDSELTAERKASNSKAAVAALSDVQQLPDMMDHAIPEKSSQIPKAASPAPQPPSLEYKARASAEQSEPEPAPSSSSDAPTVSTSPSGERPPQRPVQKNPGRCFACNKKVGLTGFKCRCEYVFCGAHRLAEAHNCSFDYKQMERQRLAQNNPLIQAAKINKM